MQWGDVPDRASIVYFLTHGSYLFIERVEALVGVFRLSMHDAFNFLQEDLGVFHYVHLVARVQVGRSGP